MTDAAPLGLPDNPVWAALTTQHAHLAEAVGDARRYPPDVSPFAAVRDAHAGAWDDLATLVGAGGSAILLGAALFEPPAGWMVPAQGTGDQMVLREWIAGPTVPDRLLGAEDVGSMLDLVELTEPGPFRPRTVELGRYYGVHENGRLVAMAGERLRLSGWTEISAVCTHPGARGRGLAAALTRRVASGILDRGETPFLHVASGNDNARRVYERLGFEVRRQVQFAVLSAPVG